MRRKILTAAAFILISLLVIPTTAQAASDNQPFPDVGSDWDWAQEAVEFIAGEGIVQGYQDGRFRPERSVTRAEFMKMLVEARAMDTEVKPDLPFHDVEGHWVEPHLRAAVEGEIVTVEDYGDSFEPDAEASRVEMARMIVRSMGVEPADDLPDFDDLDALSAQNRDYVAQAAAEGIIKGYPGGLFKPHQTANRAEASIMLHRMMVGQPSPAALALQSLAESSSRGAGEYWYVPFSDGHFINIAESFAESDADVLLTFAAHNVQISDVQQQEHMEVDDMSAEELSPDMRDDYPDGVHTLIFSVTDRESEFVRFPDSINSIGKPVQVLSRVEPELIDEFTDYWSLSLGDKALILWRKSGAPGPDVLVLFDAEHLTIQGESVTFEQDGLMIGDRFEEGVYVIALDVEK